jgi:hypothetical protein
LLELLAGEGAHMTLEEAVADFPDEAINSRPPNVSYTPWQLLEHIRLTQADILEYVVNPDYIERSWPVDYWPAADAEATPKQWAETIRGCLADRKALADLVADPEYDVFAVIPNTPGHTLLREVRVAADHTAYHVGEFAILREVMGTWPAAH